MALKRNQHQLYRSKIPQKHTHTHLHRSFNHLFILVRFFILPWLVFVLSFFWHPTCCLTLNASPYNAYVMRLSPLGILCFGYHTQNTRHDSSDLNSCDVTIYLFLCCLQIIFHFFFLVFLFCFYFYISSRYLTNDELI